MDKISRAVSGACVALYSHLTVALHRHANTFLFLLGVSLVFVGMERLTEADINPPEKAEAQKVAEKTNTQPAEAAQGRLADPAVAVLAPGAVARLADPATGRLAEGATGRLAEAATPRPAEAAQNQLAEAAIPTPAESQDIPFDDTLIRNGVGNLYQLIEGAFGALIVVGAGIGAIIAATMGAYKAALALLVVSVGAFILRAYVSLFFGTDYEAYRVGEF